MMPIIATIVVDSKEKLIKSLQGSGCEIVSIEPVSENDYYSIMSKRDLYSLGHTASRSLVGFTDPKQRDTQ